MPFCAEPIEPEFTAEVPVASSNLYQTAGAVPAAMAAAYVLALPSPGDVTETPAA